MAISNEFVTGYAKLKDNLLKNYKEIIAESFKDVGSEMEQGLPDIARYLYECSIPEAEQEPAGSNDELAYEFLFLVCISSLYGKNSLEKMTEDLKAQNTKFGYADFVNSLKSIKFLDGRQTSLTGNTVSAAFDRMATVVRTSVTGSQYIKEDICLKDLKWVQDYVCPPDSKRLKSLGKYADNVDFVYNKFFREVCEGVSSMSEVDEDTSDKGLEVAPDSTHPNLLNDIVERYAEVFAANFGIDPYVGVWSHGHGDSSGSMVVGLAPLEANAHPVNPVSIFKHEYMPVFEKVMDGKVIISDNRQFDYTEINQAFTKNKDVYVYFPRKILEFVAKTEIFANAPTGYMPCQNTDYVKSLANFKKYVTRFFRIDLRNYARATIKARLTSEGKLDDSPEELMDWLWTDGGKKECDYITALLKYYSGCVSTMLILTKIDIARAKVGQEFAANINSFRFKVCLAGDVMSNNRFCEELALQRRVQEYAGDLTETKKINGFTITDYAYVANAQAALARPLFAYKALDALTAQGIRLKWENVLLGRYDDDSICFSEKDGGKITLQANQVHWIIAGSRSGKGVMCFNLFATLLASGIPLFYMDRKPDTSVVIREYALSQGQDIYAVDGASESGYNSGIDINNTMKKHDLFKIPIYIKNDPAWGVLAPQMVYTRGLQLVLLLACFLDGSNSHIPQHQQLKNMMKAADGTDLPLAIVLDEFTEMLNGFIGRWKSKDLLLNTYNADYVASQFKSMFSSLSSAVNKDKDVENALAELKGEDGKVGDLLAGLYKGAFVNSWDGILRNVCEASNLSGGFRATLQIFIIGQESPAAHIPDDYLSFNLSFTKAGDSLNVKQGNPIINFLNSDKVKKDMILGYQPDRRGYLGQGTKGTMAASQLTALKRGFAYKKISTVPSETKAYWESVENTKDTKFINSCSYFRPFLILNNGAEPTPDQRVFIEKLKGTSAKAAAKQITETCKEAQFVGQCYLNCYNNGLSWDALVADNNDGSGHIRSEVGFGEYIQAMSNGGNSVDAGKSAKIMDIFVKDVLKYPDGWEKFLFDLTPEAMFNMNTIMGIQATDTREDIVKRTLGSTFLSNSVRSMSTIRREGKVAYSLKDLFSDVLDTIHVGTTVGEARNAMTSFSRFFTGENAASAMSATAIEYDSDAAGYVEKPEDGEGMGDFNDAMGNATGDAMGDAMGDPMGDPMGDTPSFEPINYDESSAGFDDFYDPTLEDENEDGDEFDSFTDAVDETDSDEDFFNSDEPDPLSSMFESMTQGITDNSANELPIPKAEAIIKLVVKSSSEIWRSGWTSKETLTKGATRLASQFSLADVQNLEVSISEYGIDSSKSNAVYQAIQDMTVEFINERVDALYNSYSAKVPNFQSMLTAENLQMFKTRCETAVRS